MKFVRRVLFMGAMALLAIAIWDSVIDRFRTPAVLLPLTIERIETLSALTTLKVEVADAQVTELKGRTGRIKAVLVIRGDFTVGVDLAEARFDDVDRRTQTAVLILPEPRVQSVRLDEERTKLVGFWTSGLWLILPDGDTSETAAVNMAYRDGQRAVMVAAEDPAVTARARAQAEQVLKSFFGAIGWTVRVDWVQ